jgi:hypothetical protein
VDRGKFFKLNVGKIFELVVAGMRSVEVVGYYFTVGKRRSEKAGKLHYSDID